MKKAVLSIMFVLLTSSMVWAVNEYYSHGSFPSPSSPATSAGMRAEFDLISSGFDKLPVLTGNGNKLISVNSGGTALTTMAGGLSLSGNLTLSGPYNTTLSQTATTTLTLPNASGTLATLAGVETLTSKILASPTFSGSYTLGGSATLASTVTTGQYIGAPDSLAGFSLFAAKTGSGGSFARGIGNSVSVTGGASDSLQGTTFNSSFTKAGSGTHTLIDGVFVGAPTISGSATATDAATLRVAGPPASGATNLYALKVDSGLVSFGGGQIKFPASQNASSDVNTLDDYEEGNWTPNVGGTATYTVQQGHYTKVGRLVCLNGKMNINAIGTGDTTTILGVPFQSSYDAPIAIARSSSLSTSVVSITGVAISGNFSITLFSRTAASTSDAQTSVLGSGSSLSFAGCYNV